MGALPANLGVLNAAAVNGQGQSAGPFLGSTPTPPPGGSPAWPAAYSYNADTAPGGAVGATVGAFVVCATGDGVSANSGGVNSCP
jgi:hypothetical protein